MRDQNAGHGPQPRGYRARLVDSLIADLLAELPGVLLVGPRASGKTTTAIRHAETVVRLDREAEAVAFRADPDAALRGLPEPVLSTNGRRCRPCSARSSERSTPSRVLAAS